MTGVGRRGTRSPGPGVALALLLGLAPAARAGDTTPARADTTKVATDPTALAEEGVRHDGRRTVRRLPTNLGRGIVGVFHGDNLVPLLVGGTAAATASFFDADVQESLQATTQDWGDALRRGRAPSGARSSSRACSPRAGSPTALGSGR